MKIYNKEQINKLRKKFIENQYAETMSKSTFSLIQNLLVKRLSSGEDSLEFKNLPSNEIVRKKIISVLRELGYGVFESGESQNEITIVVDKEKIGIDKLSDLISYNARSLYMRYPVMPAYCALVILELSKESETGSMILIINKIADRVVNKINSEIAEKISKTGAFNASIEVHTCGNGKYLSITDEIFAGVESIVGTPFERLFRDICLKGRGYRLVQKKHGVIAEFNGEDFEGYIMDFESRKIVINVLRAPVLAKLTKELNRSGLKFEGAGWDSSIIAITID